MSVSKEREITITASYADPGTRTERAADGSVLWSPGDQISLFYGSGTDGGSCFTAQNTEVAATANFTGTIGVITGGNDISIEDTWFWATYPYNPAASCDGSSITTALPSAQVAKANSFADNTFPSIGRSEGLDMGFYNICGGLKITISEPDLKSITLQGNNNEVLAGTITAAFDGSGVPVVTNIENGSTTVTVSAPDGETLQVGSAYYIVIVPTVFENGFSLTFRKANYIQAVYNRTDKVNIRRSRFGALSNKDAGLEWSMAPSITFPDPNFNAYMMQNFDTNGNGVLEREEALAVTNISVNTDNIESVEGISYCTNLQSLNCYGTRSIWNSEKQISVGTGHLTSLDISLNTALHGLNCNYNQLTSLNVSQNTALQELDCNYNQLTSLNVSNNTALTSLYCYSNQLTSLDVSSNTVLQTLYCSGNPLISLDVSHNTALTRLNCSFNQLTSLDVSANTALMYLHCNSNQLTSLDMSANTALTYLYCYSNQLTSLDVSQNSALIKLECNNNKLTGLDVSNNTALTYLYCYSNKLTSLDVSNNTALASLYCNNNQLTSLDVSNNTALTSLYCYSNQLTSLDVSHNSYLSSLNCFGNYLTSLNVSNNVKLSSLDCAPMNNGSGINLLATLTVADGVTIPNVTENRNNDCVPDATVINSVPIVFAVPDAVDLGLSVKWASFNVGATKPYECGYLYAWGETELKSSYDWSTYKWCNGSSSTITKYNNYSDYGTVDNKTVLDLEDDVAHIKLGGSWRMPTNVEFTELTNTSNCSWQWEDNYNNTGIKGYVVTSKKAGYTDKFIFFPAAANGKAGYYWSSNAIYWDRACLLSILNREFDSRNMPRCDGLFVRPVTE